VAHRGPCGRGDEVAEKGVRSTAGDGRTVQIHGETIGRPAGLEDRSRRAQAASTRLGCAGKETPREGLPRRIRSKHHALESLHAEVVLEQAGIFEQVDLHVAVRPKADAGARSKKRVSRHRAVAEVPFRRWTRTHIGFRAAEITDLLACNVNGVNRGEVSAQKPTPLEQFHGPGAMFRDAGLHLSRLLGDMHVDGKAVGVCITSDLTQIIEGNGANAVRGNRYPRTRRRGDAWNGGAKRIRIGEEILHARRQEPGLPRIGGLPPARAHVRGAQQGDAQSDLFGSAQNLERQQVAFIIRSAAGCVMHIMKFAHSGDSGEEHLQKSHARGMIHGLRREQIRGVIHALAPGPEGLAFRSARMLRAPADHALKGVRMDVHQARQNGPIREAPGVRQIGRFAGKARDLAVRADEHRQAGFECAAGVNEIGEPAGLLSRHPIRIARTLATGTRRSRPRHETPLCYNPDGMSNPAVYAPSEEFVSKAHVRGIQAYRDLYRRAEENPEEFWGEVAEREIHWFEKWSRVLEWNLPFAKWFAGAKTNVSFNCLDRHLATPRKNKVAILWEGEPGEQRFLTYQELHRLVVRFASALNSRGYKTGDRAIIYMPMIPELPIAILACSRLGIIHSV